LYFLHQDETSNAARNAGGERANIMVIEKTAAKSIPASGLFGRANALPASFDPRFDLPEGRKASPLFGRYSAQAA